MGPSGIPSWILVQHPSRIGVLWNPTNQGVELKIIQEAAANIRLSLIPMEARSAQEIDKAFEGFGSESVQAVTIIGDGFLLSQCGSDARIRSQA
jgi:hypothetical protein